jgi:pimeloyl-ACP methyl ester carboxylesterase
VDVDPARIEAFASYSDPTSGIRERFITPNLGGGRTVGIISEPLTARPSAGWVIAHSFGPEFEALGAFEATCARVLAGHGFAVLRFHAQGYGDSQLDARHISLSSHVLGTVEAASLLEASTGVSHVGLLGVRFGAMVAALAADRVDAHALALIDPVVRGRSLVRSLVRLELTADLSDGAAAASKEDPWQAAERTGVFELEGAQIDATGIAEIESADLLSDLGASRAPCLLVQLSRSSEPRADLQRLSKRLRETGSTCMFETIVDKDALRFGRSAWRLEGVGNKVDVLSTLSARLLEATVSWCDTALPSRPRGDGRVA